MPIFIVEFSICFQYYFGDFADKISIFPDNEDDMFNVSDRTVNVNQWTCSLCNTPNTSDECASCGEFKETDYNTKHQQGTTTWTCSSCCVTNDVKDQVCPCCNQPKNELVSHYVEKNEKGISEMIHCIYADFQINIILYSTLRHHNTKYELQFTCSIHLRWITKRGQKSDDRRD